MKKDTIRNTEIQRKVIKESFLNRKISITLAHQSMIKIGYGKTRAYQIVNQWNAEAGYISAPISSQGMMAR